MTRLAPYALWALTIAVDVVFAVPTWQGRFPLAGYLAILLSQVTAYLLGRMYPR